jgi:hypothetical protein
MKIMSMYMNKELYILTVLYVERTIKCQEYLETGLPGSMKNSNLIHTDLSTSGPSTLSSFSTLEINVGRRHLSKEGGKAAEDL